MRGTEALASAARRLRDAGVDDPARDARLLLAHVLDVPPGRLSLHTGNPLTEAQSNEFHSAVAARAARQPLSQITGSRIFWGRTFRVTPDTLDPRPETEILIAEALARPFARVLDLGTGTGCILVTLLAERSDATGIGIDVSAAVLAVARQNADMTGVGSRATFVQSSWLDDVTGSFDLIVSNPPYIAADEMAGLAPEVRDHEPHLALSDGGDGLGAYRCFARPAFEALVHGGGLIVEIGPTQGVAVAKLFASAGFADIRVLPDMDGRDRVVAARRPDAPA